MVRTQVYLQDEEYKELQLLTLMGEGSLSQLIRDGVRSVINKKKKNKVKKGFDPLKDFGNLLKGGDNDLSSKIDYYVYEEPYLSK